MPETTESSNVVLHRTKYIPSLGSCPRVEEYNSRTSSYKSETSPAEADTIQRLTPTNKGMDPTSRGPYSTVTRSAARLSKTGSYTDYGWCTGARRSTRPVYWSNLVLPTYSPSHLSETTGWEVPMRLKIKSNAVNLGVAMAEYRQTCSMFASAARSVMDAARKLAALRKDLRSGRVPRAKYLTHFHKPSGNSAKAAIGRLADARLLASYGIRPLVSDLSASVQELSDALNDLTIVKKYYVRKTKSVHWSPDVGTLPAYNTQGTHEISDTVTVFATFRPSQYGHFTNGNIAELVWETIPFSFVVDSLINVGGVLSGLDYMNGVESIAGSRTRRVLSKYDVGDDAFGYTIDDAGKGTERYYSRTPVASIPLPTNPFSYSPSTSYNTVINHVALLVSLKGWR